MKKRILSILLIIVMAVCMTACSGTLIGKWNITEISTAGFEMGQDEIKEMGIEAGFIKLNKSGNCKINFMDDEYDGSWTEVEEGQIEIKYGDDSIGEGVIEDGVMTFTDAEGTVYTLEK